MVENSRTALRVDTLRPLMPPRPVAVSIAHGEPDALWDGAEPVGIEAIQDRWAVSDEWWRDPIRRRYYRVRTAARAIRTIYYDAVGHGWFEQAY